VPIAIELQIRTFAKLGQSAVHCGYQHQERVEERRKDAGDSDHHAEVTTGRRFVILALMTGEFISDRSRYQRPQYRYRRRDHRHESDIFDAQSHLRHVQRKKRKETSDS